MEHSPTTGPIPLRLITRNLAVRVGVVVALVIALVGIFGPLLSPHDPRALSFIERLTPPVWHQDGTSKHILGTDCLGRDVLSRLLYSFRPDVIGGALALVLGTCAAVILVALRTRGETESGNKQLPPGEVLEDPIFRLSVIIIFAGTLPLIAIMAVLGSSFLNVIIPTAFLASILPMSLVYQAVRWTLHCKASPGEVQLTDTAVGLNPVRLAIRTSVALAPVTFSWLYLWFCSWSRFSRFWEWVSLPIYRAWGACYSPVCSRMRQPLLGHGFSQGGSGHHRRSSRCHHPAHLSRPEVFPISGGDSCRRDGVRLLRGSNRIDPH